jgi:CheY-like chemotaxis protein
MVATRKTILLVEDQDDQTAFLTNLLAAGGYRTIVATDTADGLRISKSNHPDLVIIDMMLPSDQGIRLYRALKASDDLRTLPVVMISCIDKQMFFQCHRIHEPQTKNGLPLPDAYIEMPPEADELIHIVAALSGREEKRC